MLTAMDWHFERSPSRAIQQWGRERLRRLRELQVEVDPDGVNWVAASGRRHEVPMPAVVIGKVVPAVHEGV